MVELKKVKARKKTYKFELKRKYEYVSHYKTVERPPIERIKDALKAFLAPKREEKKIEKRIRKEPPKGGFNFAVFGAAILVAVIILALGWLYLESQLAQLDGAIFEPQLEKPTIENAILKGHILSSGERGAPLYTSAVFVDYQTSNLNNYTISLTTYDEKIPSEVFILNSHRIEATTYSDFIRVLRSNLTRRHIMLNEITIKDLETIPQGALVIIPSGVIPKEVIGLDSLIDMRKLADKGVVVLYVGQPFDKMLNGTVVVTTPDAFLFERVPVTFDELFPLTSTDGFSLFQPLYRATGVGGWSSSLVYGSVSIVKRGNGAFIFLPQTLDGGWRGDYTAAANDVARIIYEVPWAEPTSETRLYEFANLTDYSGSRYFFTEHFENPNGTTRVDFTGYSAASNFPVQETLYITLDKGDENELFIKDGVKVVPTNITEELARITAMLREPEPAQPDMFLIISDVNESDVATFPQGIVSVQADRSFDIPVHAGKGEYIIKLIDDESKIHAQSYMKVVTIDIIYKGVSRKKPSIYLFEVSMDGNPVTLGEVTVTVDQGNYGTYTFDDVNLIEVDVGSRTGDQTLPLGDHSFEFVSGSLTTEIPITHERRRTIFDDPLFWLVLILTGGIVGLGAVFARQESIFYFIDIPYFPPVTRTKVPLSPDVVLSLFQKINDNYRWENTPLTPAELKSGFKDIFHKGRPIFITDYNVEYLLDELEAKGMVKAALGYHGLTAWEKKTGHSMDYLAIMRHLRDICVNNAVPFTGIGESREADSVITVVGQQMYLHFFEREGDIESMFKSVLKSINKGITIILFKSQAEKRRFVSLLNSSPSVAPLILKMEADSKALLFNTTEELEAMIKEFKSV